MKRKLQKLDLTNDTRCYTHYLKDSQSRLRKTAFNKTVDIDFYRAIVCKTIKPANWTAKKVLFVKTINELETKQDIYYYIANSIKKAENFVK